MYLKAIGHSLYRAQLETWKRAGKSLFQGGGGPGGYPGATDQVGGVSLTGALLPAIATEDTNARIHQLHPTQQDLQARGGHQQREERHVPIDHTGGLHAQAPLGAVEQVRACGLFEVVTPRAVHKAFGSSSEPGSRYREAVDGTQHPERRAEDRAQHPAAISTAACTTTAFAACSNSGDSRTQYHQTPADEASHEPDLQAEVVLGPGGLRVGHQQEGVGHDADQGEGDEGEPHKAGTLSRAHGKVPAKDRQRVKVSLRFPGPEGKNKPGAKVARRCGGPGSS